MFAQVSVPTGQYDNNRTNSNLSEQLLNPSNVRPATFGKLFVRALDGVMYAEPLYLPDVSIPGQGVHNVVYCATMQNTVYAFDADDPAAAAPLWSTNLGTAVTGMVSLLIQPSWGNSVDPRDRHIDWHAICCGAARGCQRHAGDHAECSGRPDRRAQSQ